MTISTKISAAFLAAVLVAGTIALSSPSFMRDVQAQQDYDGTYNNYENDYGKDRDKSKDNKIVKKVDCNNIDANINGLEIDGFPPALSGLAASETDEGGERDANSYGSYDGSGGEQQSGYDNNKNSFKFVCINNNNNTVIGGEQEEPIPELPDLACEECFAANSTLQTAIEDFLTESDAVTFSFLFSEDGIGEGFLIRTETDTIEQLCAQIENAVEELGVPLSDELIEEFFSFILGEGFEDGIDTLIECLLEAGIIVDREPPPSPDSISANGIAGANSQCIGDPICARLQ